MRRQRHVIVGVFSFWQDANAGGKGVGKGEEVKAKKDEAG
jgi:hypothetical protein